MSQLRPAVSRVRLIDSVQGFLLEHAATGYCNGCLSKHLQVPPARIAVATAQLEGAFGFDRRYERCSACNTERLVITTPRARAGAA